MPTTSQPAIVLNTFGARYYASALARFMTPDWSEAPEAVPYADLGNPQSLNLYSYVLDNPVTAADPDGHQAPATCKEQTFCQSITVAAPGLSAAERLTLDFNDFMSDLAAEAATAGALAVRTVATAANVSLAVFALTEQTAGPKEDEPYSEANPPDAAALIDLAKQAKQRGGVTREEAEQLMEWGKEAGVKVREDPPHPARSAPTSRQPHLHIGPVDHIPIIGGGK